MSDVYNRSNSRTGGSNMDIRSIKEREPVGGIDPTIPFFIHDRDFSNVNAFQHNWSFYRTNLPNRTVEVLWTGGGKIVLRNKDAKRFLYLLRDKESYLPEFDDKNEFGADA